MAKTTKMETCAHCGAEIAASAKVCPSCGGKNKKPIYKRVWFWVLVVVLVLGIAGGSMSDDSDTSTSTADNGKTQEQKIEYTKVTADQLMTDLDDNPAAAADKYKGKYFEVEGELFNVDASGDYIGIEALSDELISMSSITCYLKSDDQLEAVKKMSKGQTVTVKGKITDVGEVLGYTMDIDSIK